MADVVIAKQGDTLDRLLWRERGLGADDLPAALEANPGIAGHGAILPVGTAVTVPPRAPAPPTRPLVQLWS